MDVQKVRNELDYFSSTFDTWMRKTIRWYVEKYKGDPPENYCLRDKEIEIIHRYKEAMKSL